jgi:hypothetical protein
MPVDGLVRAAIVHRDRPPGTLRAAPRQVVLHRVARKEESVHPDKAAVPATISMIVREEPEFARRVRGHYPRPFPADRGLGLDPFPKSGRETPLWEGPVSEDLPEEGPTVEHPALEDLLEEGLTVEHPASGGL